VCRAAHNVGLELLLNTFARWPDEAPKFVATLYDDCANGVDVYPVVIDLIKSRDGESARTLARRALEEIDEAWFERHPPPAQAAETAEESATGSASVEESKGDTGRKRGPKR